MYSYLSYTHLSHLSHLHNHVPLAAAPPEFEGDANKRRLTFGVPQSRAHIQSLPDASGAVVFKISAAYQCAEVVVLRSDFTIRFSCSSLTYLDNRLGSYLHIRRPVILCLRHGLGWIFSSGSRNCFPKGSLITRGFLGMAYPARRRARPRHQ